MITFGPVPSRRLGKSLGINNIIPPKTCSYNCIYCQVGQTIRKSSERESFYEPQLIYENVTRHLETTGKNNLPEYLTFVSSGEPTLDKNLGKSIRLLKSTGIRVAVISNASTLYHDSVKEDLDQADLVSLKMDAGDIITWYLVNRPAKGLNFCRMLTEIMNFSSSYSGRLFTETMMVSGFNDSAEDASALAGMIKELKPEKAYLSVPTRPPLEKNVKPSDPNNLNMVWQIFNEMKINTELMTGFEGTDTGYTGNAYEDILNIAAVHPLREDTIRALLEKDGADYSIIESLISQHLIKQVSYEGRKYFLRDYHFNI
jgi:wyosine [tRNA(Phe)-imidazoG37] synthetase (radical SAM superfamily)